MIDWESDPDLKNLRDDFISSLKGRLEKIILVQEEILNLGISSERIYEGQIIAHSLAGIAETYGFPILTLIAAKLDDFLDFCSKNYPTHEILEFMNLLELALKETVKGGIDSRILLEDVRMKRLTFAVESLLD